MSQFNIISATSESTVVAEYTPDACRSDSYQSEAALEQEFLRLLCAQGYEYLEIHDEAALIANLRRQLEGLNDYAFSDSEWTRFFRHPVEKQACCRPWYCRAKESSRLSDGAARRTPRLSSLFPCG